MALRALSLAAGQPFIASPGQCFGWFTGTLDDLAIHPAGYAVALSIATSTLQVVRSARWHPTRRRRRARSMPSRACGRACCPTRRPSRAP